MRFRAIVGSFACLAFAASVASADILDDFNRPNGPVGANWQILRGAFRVENNHGRGAVGQTFAEMTWVGPQWDKDYFDTVGELDVFMTQPALNYSGPRLGIGAGEMMIKIQGQVAPYDKFPT